MPDDLRLIVFFLELPDPLPLPDETVYTLEVEGRLRLPGVEVRQTAAGPALPLDGGALFVSLRVWQVDVDPVTLDDSLEAVEAVLDRALPAGLIRPRERSGDAQRRGDAGGETLAATRTVVEAVTPLLPGEDAVSEAFDRCLDALSQVFAAYRSSTRNLVPAPTYERLSPVILYATRTARAPVVWDERLSLFVLHANVRATPPALAEHDLEQLNTWLSVRKRGHPLMPYAERELDARLALDTRGDYAAAVVSAQTAAEVLVDSLLTLLLWEEDADPADAATLFSEGLQKRVRTHFGTRLGGDWNTRGSGPVGTWGTFLAPLRNRIVHAGHHPTRAEAREALSALADLSGFVSDRLADKRTAFPRTALLVLGRPGLERRGRWGGQVEDFVETHADEEPDWIASYRAWRDRLDEARTGSATPVRESSPA